MFLHSYPSRRAFTLVEAMVAITVTAVAGAAVLTGIGSAFQNTQWTVEETIGQGLAQQLIDEISGKFYCATKTNGYDYPFGRTSYEDGGTGRERYSDLGDYNGVRAEPAKDLWGIQLGVGDGQGDTRVAALQVPNNYFSRWRQEVDCYYVSNSNQSTKLAAGQTSDFRCVEVRILYDDPTLGLRPITTLKKVFAYVSPP